MSDYQLGWQAFEDSEPIIEGKSSLWLSGWSDAKLFWTN
jgi:hypothetical protein